jgi:hypothetical protein
MHRHEMQQSNIYLGIYIIEYYFFWKNQGVTATPQNPPIEQVLQHHSPPRVVVSNSPPHTTTTPPQNPPTKQALQHSSSPRVAVSNSSSHYHYSSKSTN